MKPAEGGEEEVSGMRAVYNEIDPFAAEWLGNLIAAGELPQGNVNTCSIKELSGDDCGPTTHLFAGIGGWPLALRLAGWPGNRTVWTGSCPCQPYSAAGKGKGDADERNLWPEMYRLIRECRPPVIFGEQVPAAIGHGWLDGIEPAHVQRMRGAETLLGVLQELEGGVPEELQRMLTGRREMSQEGDPHGEEEWRFQSLSEEEQSQSFSEHGEVSSESEQQRILSNERGHGSISRDNESRRLCGDGASVQPRRRENMGQPLSGSDRQQQGLHAGQCTGGSLLCECHGEYVGREHDHEDRGRDGQDSPSQVRRPIRAFGGRIESAAKYPELTGIRSDLEKIGYSVGAVVLGAHSVGSPNIRQRLFWVADSPALRRQRSDGVGEQVWRPREASNDGRPNSGDEQTERQASLESGNGNPWDDCRIIPCKDGKSRRVGRSVQPLAHGIPVQLRPMFAWLGRLGIDASPLTKMARLARRNRTGRLKGYGNAINPFVAAEFIRAFLEVEKEQHAIP